MTVHVASHAARPTRPSHAAHLSPHDVLHLALALCCALTGTTWGAAMAVVVLGVLAAQHAARRVVQRSAAVRRGVLATTQHTGPLHAAGHAREAVARP